MACSAIVYAILLFFYLLFFFTTKLELPSMSITTFLKKGICTELGISNEDTLVWVLVPLFYFLILYV